MRDLKKTSLSHLFVWPRVATEEILDLLVVCHSEVVVWGWIRTWITTWGFLLGDFCWMGIWLIKSFRAGQPHSVSSSELESLTCFLDGTLAMSAARIELKS